MVGAAQHFHYLVAVEYCQFGDRIAYVYYQIHFRAGLSLLSCCFSGCKVTEKMNTPCNKSVELFYSYEIFRVFL